MNNVLKLDRLVRAMATVTSRNTGISSEGQQSHPFDGISGRHPLAAIQRSRASSSSARELQRRLPRSSRRVRGNVGSHLTRGVAAHHHDARAYAIGRRSHQRPRRRRWNRRSQRSFDGDSHRRVLLVQMKVKTIAAQPIQQEERRRATKRNFEEGQVPTQNVNSQCRISA